MDYAIGQIVEGIVIGIQPYGAFVNLNNEYKGLIHISEISDHFVNDVNQYIHMNQRVCVKILGFDEEDPTHLKLSFKAVTANKSRFQKNRKLMVQALPPNQIGFSSLQQQLSKWIKAAQQNTKRRESTYD